MATKVILIDDIAKLVGREEIADEKVTFGLDGVWFSIDLTTERAKKLREDIGHYALAGERLDEAPRKKSTPKPSYNEREALHDWLRGRGQLDQYETKTLGKYRIPREVWHEFRESLRG